MAVIVVFHHVHGLTPGVSSFAGRLREAGHTVIAPDLFAGERFDTIEAGAAHASSIGFDVVIERGVAAVAELEQPFTVVGFSLGVLPAQRLAQSDERIRAAVLCHSCVPLEEFGDEWPDSVAVQIHAMEEDPYFLDDGDMDAALD
ncbi:MAG: dienelactone hydrolase family protein, partial [Actinomycetota bacterium]